MRKSRWKLPINDFTDITISLLTYQSYEESVLKVKIKTQKMRKIANKNTHTLPFYSVLINLFGNLAMSTGN